MHLAGKVLAWVATAGAAAALLLWPTAAAGSVVLTLSQSSSDSTPAEYLDACLTFDVYGSVLTLTVENNTLWPHEYYINQIFFNATDNVTGLTLIGSDDWTLNYEEDGNRASPFGDFDVALVTRNNQPHARIAAGQTAVFTFGIQGTGTYDAWDFATELSAVRGGHIPSLAAAKFVSGPCDDSARGNVTDGAVPEPATLALLASGMAFVFVRRKK